MEILLEKGIPGFEEYKNFIVKDMTGNSKFKVITSIKNSKVGFIATSPFEVKRDYEINLSDEIINELNIEKSTDVWVLSLVTLGKTIDTSTVNLKAPIIININNNKGKQLILQEDTYKIKEPLIIGSEKYVGNY